MKRESLFSSKSILKSTVSWVDSSILVAIAIAMSGIPETAYAQTNEPAPTATPDAQADFLNQEKIQNKLDHIIIPKIDFQDTTVREAVDFLKQKTRELDTTKPPGVSIVLKLESTYLITAPRPAPTVPGLPRDFNSAATPVAPVAPPIDPGEARITVPLTKVTLRKALRRIAGLAGMKIKVDPNGVTILPLTLSDLPTIEYQVPRGFRDPSDHSGTGSNDRPRVTAKEFLTAQGVEFPPGCTARYFPDTHKLIVRNTEANLGEVEEVLRVFSVKERDPPDIATINVISEPVFGSEASRAEHINIPKVEFKNIAFKTAVKFLRAKARELDPDKKGINIVVKTDQPQANVDLSSNEGSVLEILGQIASQNDLYLQCDEHALFFTSNKVK